MPAPVISTWTGGAGANNPNWSAPKNWTNGVPKVDGDQATFDGTSVANATVDIVVVLAKLTITNAYTGTIDNQSPNLVKLTGNNSSMANGTWMTEGIDIAGTFNWTGGTFKNLTFNSVETNATLNITGTGSKTLDALLNFSVSGTANWDGAGPIVFKNGSSFEQGGTFNVTGGGTMQDGGGATNSFDNVADSTAGKKFVVNLGAANTVTIHVKLVNLGGKAETDVDSGTLLVDGGSQLQGKIIVANDAQLTLASMDPKVDALDGVTIITGTTVFLGHVTVTSDSNLETTVLDKSVLLDGASTLSIGADYTWFGNGPWSGSGQMTVTGLGGHLKLDQAGQAAYALGRTIDNLGMVTWSQRDISVRNGANITNEDSATFDIQVDKRMFDGGGAGVFTNNANATLKKSAGKGNTIIDIPTKRIQGDEVIDGGGAGRIQFTKKVVSAGTTQIDGAGIDFLGGFEQDAGGTTLVEANQATMTVSGGDLTLTGGTMTVTVSNTLLSVTGNIKQSGGTMSVAVSDSVTCSVQYLETGGNIEMNYGGAISATNGMTMSGGAVLEGTGNFTVYTSVLTNGGQINPGWQNGLPGLGQITVSGNYTQTSTGILDETIFSNGGSVTSDELNVTGTATLNGTINVNLSGTNPGSATVILLSYGTRVGQFTGWSLPSGWSLVYATRIKK